MKILSVLAIVSCLSGCAVTYPIGENGKYGYIEAKVQYVPNLAGILNSPNPATIGDK